MFLTLATVTAKSTKALFPSDNNLAGLPNTLSNFEESSANDTGASPPILIDVCKLLTSVQSSNLITGQQQTTFKMGGSVEVNFNLCTGYSSGVLYWRLTLRQPDNSVYSVLQSPAFVSTTPRTMFCVEPILAGVQTGEWTGEVQLYAFDAVTPLGAATLQFTVTGF